MICAYSLTTCMHHIYLRNPELVPAVSCWKHSESIIAGANCCFFRYHNETLLSLSMVVKVLLHVFGNFLRWKFSYEHISRGLDKQGPTVALHVLQITKQNLSNSNRSFGWMVCVFLVCNFNTVICLHSFMCTLLLRVRSTCVHICSHIHESIL